MAVVVDRYRHRTGEHCASTALRNLLAHHGTELSEGMIFGLAAGLGFYYIRADEISPTRMFHGRTATLESDFGANTAMDFVDRSEPDDERAWQLLRQRLDAGEPVMLSTDTFYLGYHRTTSHFPGHRCVVVGYNDETGTVLIADRKFAKYQRCSYEELRRSRHAPDYPMSCDNTWGDFGSDAKLGRPLEEAIVVALRRNAEWMLDPPAGPFAGGIPAMRTLAEDLPTWGEADDWSWAARFGYQVIVKRGAAGSFFRTLYAEFLRESAPLLPRLGEAKLAQRMDAIAALWRDLAAPLKEQSERETCDPALFAHAAELAARLAGDEEVFFQDALSLTKAA